MTKLYLKLQYWYRKYIPKSVSSKISKLINNNFKIQLLLFKLKTKIVNYKKTGFEHLELVTIENIVTKVGLEEKSYIDIGAGNGFSSSATYAFAKNSQWTGLSIEASELSFKKMAYIYKNFKNAIVNKEKVTPNNIIQILDNYEVPKDFGILNIDIDSYDLDVLKAMIDNKYKPSIISAEINEKIPPPVEFSVSYDEKHFYNNDDFYGCSISALYNYLSKKDYILVDLLYINAIFVERKYTQLLEPLTDSEAYEAGYKNRTDKYELLKHNEKFDELLHIDSSEVIDYINNLFQKYEGRYYLKKP
jgi:hypothetical protein